MTPPAPVRAAIAGVLHGVVEWLPVSSSGHVALLIDAAGWPEADPAQRQARRSLEVALHTGSLLPLGRRVLADLRAADAPLALVGAGLAATAITSVVGGTAGPLVERRFAGPRSVAAGLAAGSVALLLAERVPVRTAASPAAEVVVDSDGKRSNPRRPQPEGAPATEVVVESDGKRTDPRRPSGGGLGGLRAADVVVVGLAQGVAIWPGVSRRAATFSAARARGLDPETADVLSWVVGLPTLAAATAWQFRRGRAELLAAPAAPIAGALASAAAGHATRRLPGATLAWPAAIWATWRLALAAATLRRS